MRFKFELSSSRTVWDRQLVMTRDVHESGTRIGPYEIGAAIGAGGIGDEVALSRDGNRIVMAAPSLGLIDLGRRRPYGAVPLCTFTPASRPGLHSLASGP